MDETRFGSRDGRGYWKPFALIEYAPVFVWPPRPLQFLKWLFGAQGYLVPWNAFFLGVAVVLWLYMTPSLETLQTFSAGWIAWLLVRNAVLTFLFYGSWHLILYIKRVQGTEFKYNQNWPARDSKAFIFGSQNIDNVIWTFASGVPIWTAYEAVMLWGFANGYFAWLSWSDSPVYFIILLVLIPAIREAHFYLIHRLIHWPPLYKSAHYVHHKNINPGPWSGLSMHPIEHVLYFSGVLVHAIVLSHPVHALFHIVHAGMAPAKGHLGFDKVVIGEDRALDSDSYLHYLHHRYFECNYGDGVFPFDKLMGTFHDGSDEAHQRMRARRRAAVK